MRLPRTARRSIATAAALGSALLVPAAASADEVTTLADSGAGSLRAAIASTPEGGTVTFAPSLGGGTILLDSELMIGKDLTIDGLGADQLAISGQDATRVFKVLAPDADVTIEDVTIRDGRATGATDPIGAGVWFIFGDSLTLRRVAVRSNRVVKTDPVIPLGGGITVFSGQLSLIDSTVADNEATDGTAGGVFVGTPASFTVTSSTIAGNRAVGVGGFVSGNATGTIVASTIARNESTAQPGGGLHASGPAVVTLQRSLVTQNTAPTAPDCLGAAGPPNALASGGGNVIASLAGCSLVPVASDTTNVAAAVGQLGNHGGPTPTFLPVPGNPALDHVSAPCPPDQRGIARPQGALCDAGAVEVRAAQLAAMGPLALGSALVGEHSAPVTVEITNAGDLVADITNVSLSGSNAGEIEVVAGPDACAAAIVLVPGMSCKLTARLAPTSVGAKQATYTVSLAGSFVDVAVTGTGDPVSQSPADPSGGGSAIPSPAPQSSSAEAVLVGTRTKAGKGGKLKLRLRCATVNAGSCVGSLTLKLGARKLTKSFAIIAGRQVIVTLKLGPGDRRKLSRKRSLKSAVTVLTTQPDGTRKTTHQSSFKLLRA